MTWTRGRLLYNYKFYTNSYNADGIRVGKSYSYPMSSSLNTTAYEVDGSRILRESRTQGAWGDFTTTELEYIYTHVGLVGFVYNNEPYYYLKNFLGDIVAIQDEDGNTVATYSYDAFGNYSIGTNVGGIAYINPFRYRSYYYDSDLGLYYLNSRFYDPTTGRFINADTVDYLDPESTNGLNLYAYCLNNPVMYYDPSGHFPLLAVILGITALTGLGLTIGGVASDNNILTAVGLSMVAVPALLSGGIAVVGAIGTGATLSGVVGGVTVGAGIGTGLFASAEYQQAVTGNNWILNTGISEGWYNGLMLSTASIATLGTFASSFTHSFNIRSIDKVGKLIPKNHTNECYHGIRFFNGRGGMRSIELQLHAPHGLHFQLNSWNVRHMTVSTVKRWTWFLF